MSVEIWLNGDDRVIPPSMLTELRRQLASAISDAKAYDVPALCRKLNLGDGTEQEAFASKYRYAQKRIGELTGVEVVKRAQAFLEDDEHFELSEELAKIVELQTPQVSTLTRRRLIALFDGRPLATEIEDLDLIRVVWPVADMPATIQGFGYTLEDDIVRHTIRNDDLTQRALLETLGLLTCSKKQLFKFLAVVTSPESQSEESQASLAASIDEILRKDGYTLASTGMMSGSPVYSVKLIPYGSPADNGISIALAAFDADQVHARWASALERRASEPEGAITLARTLLEDVCKWILDDAGETWRESDDLPSLYRKLAKVLKLAPDDHTEQIFQQILGSCQSVVASLGALRNKLGDAHSAGPKRARPQARHAELAVNLSGAMATFLIATWEARCKEQTLAEQRSKGGSGAN